MKAQEIAVKYAGYKVQVTGEDVPNFKPNVYARLVGYNLEEPNTIVVQFRDFVDRARSWPLNHAVKLTVAVDSLDTDGGQLFCWNVTIGDFRVLDGSKAFDPANKKKKKDLVQKPYPDICSKCRAPARKIAEVMLCSNDKCKSRVGIVKTWTSNAKKTRVVRCPTCKGKAVDCRKAYANTARSKIQWNASCLNGHHWVHDPKPNDVITSSLLNAPLTSRRLGSRGSSDMIWANMYGGMAGLPENYNWQEY